MAKLEHAGVTVEMLLERVRSATGPDRMIDAMLCEACELPLCEEPDCLPDVLRRIIERVKVTGSADSSVTAYTASIDAALALVEKMLPENVGYSIIAFESGGVQAEIGYGMATAETAPLAILAALLEAVAFKKAEPATADTSIAGTG